MSVKTKKPENPRYFDRVNYADSGSLIVDLLRSDETRAKRFTDFVDQFHDSAGASPDLAAFDGDAFTGCTADGIMVYVCCKKDAASNDAAGYHVVFGSLASGENRAMRVWDVHSPNSARPNDRALELRPPHGAPHAIPPYAQQRLSWQVS
ncbi:MAG TPA: hypothetical protein VFQ70_02335, partial [Candidatus Saccharimonadaceae bacterium]|nr:hypothetical protein [Candidatus Saccharimonadaceae bacterium]